MFPPLLREESVEFGRKHDLSADIKIFFFIISNKQSLVDNLPHFLCFFFSSQYLFILLKFLRNKC